MIFKILKVLLAPFRYVVGGLILFYDRNFQPISLVRDANRQAAVDRETASLVLFHFEACPFCVKVRRHIKELGLKIEMRDVKLNPSDKAALIEGGGQMQVPCLRIPPGPDGKVRWMYESSDINGYLSQLYKS